MKRGEEIVYSGEENSMWGAVYGGRYFSIYGGTTAEGEAE